MKPRPEIEKLASVHHGAPDYIELEQLQRNADQIIDFSTNSNPYGPSPKVREAFAQTPLDRYPDREALALRRTLAEHHHSEISQIIAGNGTAEIIWLIALTFIRPGDRVLILGPTFGEYANAAALMGAQIYEMRAQAENDFKFDANRVAQELEKAYRVVYLCNPNNPTGQVISPEQILHWGQNHPQTLFVVDEAYLQFVPEMTSTIESLQVNLLILRSMTKDYALAGLRLGYAVGAPEVIQALGKARPPWSVNALAQAAGIAALDDQNYLRDCLKKIWQDKEMLIAELKGLGFAPIPTQTHYFLLPAGDGAEFRSALMRKGLQVRDCASFGLPEYLRIAARRPQENQQLVDAIKGINAKAPRKKQRENWDGSKIARN